MNQTHPAMTHFRTEGANLLVGGIPLPQLASRAGGTPFYAYDREWLTERVALLRRLLPPRIHLHYAMKANPMPALVCHMARLVDGLDVASAGELKIALDAGMSPAEISFAGPGKQRMEMEQGIAAGILFNVESFREARELARASQQLGLPARVAVRVNPDFELKLSGMKMGGGAKQFGVDAEIVPDLLAEIGNLGLAFEGFHIFSGSQNLKAEAIIEAQQKSLDLALRLSRAAPCAPRVFNIGGGFGIPYFPGDRPLELEAIMTHLHGLAEQLESEHPQAHMVIELGRYLVGEGGVYVCRVLDRKESRGQVFLITDGGMHHHLAASGNFGQVIRKNYPAAIGNRMDEEPTEKVSVVGPLCTPLDVLADRVSLPAAAPGDLVVIFQSGAYGPSASPSAFLSHPPSAELLV